MVDSIFRAYRLAYQGLPREIWILSFALFINRCGMMVLPFMTLYLHEERGFSEGDAAMMLSGFGCGSICGIFVGGWLTDRVGSVRVLISMLFLSVPMYLILPWMQTTPQILIAMFSLAFFSEGLRPANNAAIAEFSSKEQLTQAFGLQRMAVNLGVSFGPAVGGFLAEVNFFWLFIVDAMTTLTCASFVAFLLGWSRKSNEDEASPGATETDATEAEKPSRWIHDYVFFIFLGLLIVTSIVFFQFQSTYPLYLSDHYQLSKRHIGLICAVNTFTIVIFEMLLLAQARNWPKLRSIGWGCALACIGFGILPLSQAVWFAVLSMVIITLGEMLWMPIATGWVGQRCTTKNRGAMMGMYAMTYSIASVIAPIAGGKIYAFNKELLWYGSLGVGVLILGGFFMLARLESDPTDEEKQSVH